MKRKLNDDDVPEVVAETSPQDTTSAKLTFTTLGLDSRLLQAVNREKFSAPTPVQSKAIPVILSGKDVLARSKTGSGKTLAYILPILHAILQLKATPNPTKHTSALILVPTKELANQVTSTVRSFTAFCAGSIHCENITRKEDAAVLRARLAEHPDIVVSTPSRASQCLSTELLKLDNLKHLVIDEADLVLSYGYATDLSSLSSSLPSGVQTVLLSATLNTETTTLTNLLHKSDAAVVAPVIIDLSPEEATEKSQLSHYCLRTAEEDKFLLIYAIFKLKLIKGKVIVFVADIDRCYRVKLFLEQFGVRSCVLNSELPVNSRVHAVEEFNRGIYDVIIAADEGEVIGDGERSKKKQKVSDSNDAENEEVPEEAEPTNASTTTNSKSEAVDQQPKQQKKSSEYTLSRGIDFHHVSCVLNFDLPISAKSYLHRVGRTARAGQTGMALSFYVPKELYRKHKPTSIPQCANDEDVLSEVRMMVDQSQSGMKSNGSDAKEGGIQEWQFDMSKLEGFRYRFADALRSVTRIAVREARTRELRAELINSEKLKRHFEENPDDLRHLRHDNDLTHAVRQRPHLKHVPEYLLPEGGAAAVKKDVGYVGMRKDGQGKDRRTRGRSAGRGRGRGRGGRGGDPLRSLNARGRGKK